MLLIQKGYRSATRVTSPAVPVPRETNFHPYTQLRSVDSVCVCIPSSEYHTQCVITFVLYEMISKRTRQRMYNRKVAIWQKCIHAYLYFRCLGFILPEFLLASCLVYCTQPPWQSLGVSRRDEILVCLTPLWPAFDISQVSFMVLCQARLNTDKSLALWECGHSRDHHLVVPGLVSLCCLCCL